MSIKKVLIVFGTRPEAIKMAPVVKAFSQNAEFDCKVCVTAQHREMLDQVLSVFEITPDYDLNIMKKGQDLFDITGSVLAQIKEVYLDFKPDLVLVHGDTSTSFVAALAAFYLQIKVAHVEAGLRTWDMENPFPEEANRVLTGRLSTWHFAPTQWAADNLKREGVAENKIIVTGNTVIDALYLIRDKLQNDESLRNNVQQSIQEKGYNFDSSKRLVLITCHRRENSGDGFENIAEGIRECSIAFPDVDFVFPVHPSPKVREVFHAALANLSNVYLIEPLEYLPFVFLLSNCTLILTDSGGIQEEAPSLGKHVLVMRKVSERPEAIEAGVVKLVGTDKLLIFREVKELLTTDKINKPFSLYGDGKAAERIVTTLMAY
ncbi:non-hydrolyzing UDP-N-acetylglucosamine 2-epimerase [Fulvivirgaceae bacterium LMO-SS25]